MAATQCFQLYGLIAGRQGFEVCYYTVKLWCAQT